MNGISRHNMQRIWPNRTVLVLSLCLLCLVISSRAWATGMELLSPRSGATIVARNPLTHIVLRQPGATGTLQVKVDRTGEFLKPVVTMDDGNSVFLHFRAPLEPGRNDFTILPAGMKVELKYQRVQAELHPESFDKDVYLFHLGNTLPKACQECHDLHETETVDPGGMVKQTSCSVCHKTIVAKGSWKHSPVVNLQCLSCHLQSSKPWRIGFPKVKVQELCFNCHAGKKSWFSSNSVHGPLYSGGCTLCHDPHGANNRYMLWADGSMTLCISCHQEFQNLVSEDNRMPYVHNIIYGKGCIACHSPHASDNQFNLRKPINQLCLGCHPDPTGGLGDHPVAGHPLSGSTEHRRPGRKLTCVGCHNPHGSYYQSLLVQTKQGALLCRECHNRK